MRLGGPIRYLESDARHSALILEMAIFPPRVEQSSSSFSSSSFSSSADSASASTHINGFMTSDGAVTRINLSPLELSNLLILEPSSLTQLDLISKLAGDCIAFSSSEKERRQDLYSASSSSSNSIGMVGSWLDESYLDKLISHFNKTDINVDSELYQSIAKSKLPYLIPLLLGEGYELSAFQIPANTSLPSRRHPVGSIYCFALLCLYIHIYSLSSLLSTLYLSLSIHLLPPPLSLTY
jgi:hypothetical protein